MALSACDLGTDNDADPESLVVSPASLALDAIGASATLKAELRTGSGERVGASGVSWLSSDELVATVSPDGVVTAVGNGEATITAATGGISREVGVTVQQAAGTLELVSGSDQNGTAGQPLPAPLVVRALDRLGEVADGVSITFQVIEGGGSVSATSVETDAQGLAQTSWTLGPAAGDAHLVRAFASSSVGTAVDFSATAGAAEPDALAIVSGDGQSAPVSTALYAPVVVRVEDGFGNPVEGVTVSFAAGGGGSLAPPSAVSDADGLVSAVWTLGGSTGQQTATATATAPGVTAATFTALATAAASQIEVLAGDGQVATVGEELPVAPAVRVLDAGDQPIPFLDVVFAVIPAGTLRTLGGSVDTVLTVRTDAVGEARLGAWVLGTAPGAYQVSVTVPGLAPVVLTATAEVGAPATLTKVSGDGQQGVPGAPLPEPLVVRVADALDNPVPGVTVDFEPDAGSVDPAQVVTDAQGLAATTWTLGDDGGRQNVTATVAGSLSAVFAGAEEGLGGLVIDLRYTYTPTAVQLEAFEQAAAIWGQAIPGRLVPVPLQTAANACGPGTPAIDEQVEDLIVFVSVANIDGPAGTLGQASPCLIRTQGGLPVLSHMILDLEDMNRLEAGGSLADLVLHELAHALGFGTLWRTRGLLENPSLPNAPGADTHFTGLAAVAAFDAIGGAAYPGGKVPVENREGGSGTRDAHWRLSVMTNELMTGFMSTGANPLSRVTIASLGDIGYQVDESAADAFQLTLAGAPPRAVSPHEMIPLGDDIGRWPIHLVSPDGRVVGELR